MQFNTILHTLQMFSYWLSSVIYINKYTQQTTIGVVGSVTLKAFNIQCSLSNHCGALTCLCEVVLRGSSVQCVSTRLLVRTITSSKGFIPDNLNLVQIFVAITIVRVPTCPIYVDALPLVQGKLYIITTLGFESFIRTTTDRDQRAHSLRFCEI